MSGAAAGQPVCYLVDASIYVFRAWFTLPDTLRDAEGKPANAALGFADFVAEFLRRTATTHAAFAFDESLTSSFRNQIYPDYKANRPPAPESLKRQFRLCREFLHHLGISELASPRYEADDLLGTLAREARAQGLRVTLVTADKDLAQLVEAGDEWWDFARDRRLSPRDIHKHFGVLPAQIADCLAIAGDKIDNVPGVPGVGMATAAKLLRRFGDIDSMLADTAAIATMQVRGAARLRKLIETHRHTIVLARRLTTIHCAADLPRSVPLSFGAPNLAGLEDWMQRAGFGEERRQRWREWAGCRALETSANPTNDLATLDSQHEGQRPA